MLGDNNFRGFYEENYLKKHLCRHLPGDEIQVKTSDGIKKVRITEVYKQDVVKYNIKILDDGNCQYIPPVPAVIVDNDLCIEIPKYEDGDIY